MVTSTSAHMSGLADMLWHERRLLEFLLFKLVSANLVLIADDRRFVGPAVAEVDAVMKEIRSIEGKRDELVSLIATEWQVPASAVGLDFLAEHAPENLQATFQDHRAVFQELVGEIETLTRENRRLATVSLDGIRDTLGLTGGDTYDATGRTSNPPQTTHVDRVL